MKIKFVFKLSLIVLLLAVTITSRAQDSVNKTTPVKKNLVKPVINPTTGKVVPINPKTGKPYTRYGYYGTHKADSTHAANAADTSKKTTATPVAIDKSLNGQYQYLLTKLYNYQQPFAAALWKNITDSLKNSRNQLKDAQQKLADQNKTISGLQTDVINKDQSLSFTTSKADSISLLGIYLTKTTYNLIMWGLVIFFGAIAAVVIARSGGYRNEATHRIQLYNELDEEFKNYKNKANEKEKKLARELQTERNKVDELTGKA
jgi:hypothetical protein